MIEQELTKVDSNLLHYDASSIIYRDDLIGGFVLAQTAHWSWPKYQSLLQRVVEVCQEYRASGELNLIIERTFLDETPTDDNEWILDRIYTCLEKSSVSRIAYVCSILNSIKKKEIVMPPIPGSMLLQHKLFYSKRPAIDWLLADMPSPTIL